MLSKLTSYPTKKLTTHTLPDPKTQQKIPNPKQPTCYPTQKLNGKSHNPHSVVVSAQGPSVGATVGIRRSFGA